MKILIRENAANIFLTECEETQNGHLTTQQISWSKSLRKVQGQWLEVETEFLFQDQYNTTSGLHIMQKDVVDIEGDVREGKARCGWCGKTTNAVGACWNCNKTEYVKPFKIGDSKCGI